MFSSRITDHFYFLNMYKKSVFFLLFTYAFTAGISHSGADPAKGQSKMNSPYYAPQTTDSFNLSADGINWEFEVRVSLPGSYSLNTTERFPVLWVLDGSLYHGSAAEMVNVNAILERMPYVIVVSVGYPMNNTRDEYQKKRTKDFFFEGSIVDLSNDDDPATQIYKHAISQSGQDTTEAVSGNGRAFLDFLTGSLRTKLSQQYRMSDKHVLFGHSGGGMFSSRALFTQPDAFSGYIISSGTTDDAIQAEIEYAKNNKDLNAKVFVAAGDLEVAVAQYAAIRLVSNTVKFAENLALRNYPSLKLEVQLHHDKDHATVWPLSLSEGMIWAFQE